MIAELEADGPSRDRRAADGARRRGRRTRCAAVVAALALGAALFVPPASAESLARAVASVGRTAAAAGTADAAPAPAAVGHSTRQAARAAVDHQVTAAKAKKPKKKKKGFFAKLGIFLLVVLILVVLFVVVLIALAIRLARRAFGRRRT
ncbi:hypothetical protein ACH4UT_11550 [Streptomyces sp. NPDC020799]|uniref:hypothetical protein n=1 Tax=Streptomyces sp. NPDC020799 TaxID=3365091 RepID=UPI0037A69DA6